MVNGVTVHDFCPAAWRVCGIDRDHHVCAPVIDNAMSGLPLGDTHTGRTKMDDNHTADFAQHRSRLLAKRDELTRRLLALQRDTTAALDKDSEERATQLENRDVELALGDEANAELAEIEQALQRLLAGRYGVCIQCGGAVGVERLDAYPAATRCIACAGSQA